MRGTPADAALRGAQSLGVRGRARALMPLKECVEGLPRRFQLQNIICVALAVEVQPIAAAVLAEIHSRLRPADEDSKASLRRQRMDERLSLHRLLVKLARRSRRSPL